MKPNNILQVFVTYDDGYRRLIVVNKDSTDDYILQYAKQWHQPHEPVSVERPQVESPAQEETATVPEAPATPETSFTAGQIAEVKGINTYHDPDDDLSSPKDTQIPFDSKILTGQALFNPLFRINLWDEIWTDEQFGAKRAQMEPTVSNLLKEENPTGAKFDLNDFLYVHGQEYYTGYHMITLRRFGTPVNDCLMFDNQPQIDVGRLVTYSTQELNKLSDIMTMSFGLNWKELTADFWTPEVIGDERGASGLLGTLYQFTNPNYAKTKGLSANGLYVDPMHDQNKVYGPVDVIHKTHIRDRGINFNQDITITFKYDLKSYNGVDPKAAFMDLLSNLLLVTFNDATFWGGANIWRGKRKSYYQNYISASNAVAIGTSYKSTVEYYKQAVSHALNDPKNSLGAILEVGKALLNGIQGFALEKLCNTLGRPSVVVANSLLNGEPVGMWHLTIGNPFRPIMSIGNLILTGSKLQFGDELGADGFPTSITLTCTLKHARPRSRAEIEMMFNAGHARMYWQPNAKALKQALSTSNVYKRKLIKNKEDLERELTNEIYSRLGTQHPLSFTADAIGLNNIKMQTNFTTK